MNFIHNYMLRKTKTIYLLPIIVIINFLPSCKNQNDTQSEEEPALNINELGNYKKSGNTLITAIFDECGEWGGHSEKLRIYADSSMTVHARYVIYPFKCDSSAYYQNTKYLKPKFDTTIVLNNEKQKAIASYISRLAQAKMIEHFPGNAGRVFTVSKDDSTLIIQVYDSNQKNDDSYNRLLSELF